MSVLPCNNKTLLGLKDLKSHHHNSSPQQSLGKIVFRLWAPCGYRDAASLRELEDCMAFPYELLDQLCSWTSYITRSYCAGRILLSYSTVSVIRGTSRCHTHHQSRLVGEVAYTKPSFARCWMHVMCRALLNCSVVTIQRIQATDAMSSPYEHEHWRPPCSSLNHCRHPRKRVHACDLKNPLQIAMSRVSGFMPFFDKEWSRARSLFTSLSLESFVRIIMQWHQPIAKEKRLRVSLGQQFSDFCCFRPALFACTQKLVPHAF